MSQYSHLSALDPEFAALVAHIPRPPLPDDVTPMREMQKSQILTKKERLRSSVPADTEYRIEDNEVPVEGGKILVRCLVPRSSGEEERRLPLLVWYHGGGFVMGSVDNDDFFLRRICVDLQISIVNVGYRLAPEYPFPTGLNDCYAALKWAVNNAPSLSVSLSHGFLIGGLSAGGNMTAVIAHRARDDPFFKDRHITGQLLGVPLLVHHDAHPDKYKSELLSLEQNKDAAMLSRDVAYKFSGWVQGEPFNPEFSPLLYPSHQGLPPAYLQICGGDILRDEGLLYERLLREAEVKTKLDIYPGLPHAFHNVFPQLSASKKFEKDFSEGIQWLLRGST
ncbi:hypothetical protein AcW1_002350 [Taiwanofungus camphoratus]|nr:hypothetical protein AcV5_010356 [Antrodia cinnamomea]KAI0937985.1 hypothetical protein AcV7_003304 [Antrodia cinnamomea]KAI0944700.1 hypothetical protein AcW1_002350 [Antrodia cinnamomea]